VSAVLDPAQLDVLAEELLDRGSAVAFAQRYLAMLPARVERLELAVVAGDLEAALDRVRSLRISSAMAGAVELMKLSESIERTLRLHGVRAVACESRAVRPAAERTAAALRELLAQSDSIR